jgi:hypothetical protein
VYKAQKTLGQVFSLDNTFLCKILYIPLLLEILHILGARGSVVVKALRSKPMVSDFSVT